MLSQMWDTFTYPFSKFNGYIVEVWEWIRYFILHIMMDEIIYTHWDSNLIYLSKWDL